MSKFRITSRIYVDDAYVDLDSIEDVKAYVAENPPGCATAIDVLTDVCGVDMFYNVEEVTDNGVDRHVLTVRAGESWYEADARRVHEYHCDGCAECCDYLYEAPQL